MDGILRNKEIFKIIPFDEFQNILFFPVRHHSPACSYHLLRTIESYEPDCILVEGPCNADRLIPVLTDENTVLPVAFYYFYKDSAKLVSEEGEDYKCYYPFLNSSPEYNALKEAKKRKIDCGFIDLPYGEILIHTAENKGIRTEAEIQSYNDDRYLSENEYFKALCEKTGMRNFEEFWETYFETDGLYYSTEEFVARVHTYCYLTRENTPVKEMQEDGCLVRERFMAENIIKATETRKRVLVVTGGFHSFGLYSLVNGLRDSDKLRLHHFDEKTQNVYAMAYSFEAADALNGYSSGMQNPGFYDNIWQKIGCGAASDGDISGVYKNTATDCLLRCAKRSSKAGLLITMSDIASAVNMMEGLAALRNKKEPGLYELYDSVKSCFIKGELNGASNIPLRILSEIATGNEIGKLCSTAEKIPLLRNFEELAEKYRLKIDTIIEQKTELDIFSKKKHLAVSQFFYRMNFLETGFAKRVKGADIINNTDRSRIREIWTYKRNAAVDASLIDSSAYGGTIEEACTVTAARRIKEAQKSETAAKLYVECFLMGIDITESFGAKMNDIIINDGDFFSVGRAVYYFNMLHSLCIAYGKSSDTADYFLKKCFGKIITMLSAMINISSDYSTECIRICKMLYNIACDSLMNSEYDVLMETLKEMSEKDNPEPALYGAVLGLLYGSAPGFKEKIKSAFSGYLSGTAEMKKQGAVFLRGLFNTARDIVLVGNEFVIITDELIKSFSMEEFIEILPELRLAFSYFTPSETDSIARKAAELYGVDSGEIRRSFELYDELFAAGERLEAEILKETEGDTVWS